MLTQVEHDDLKQALCRIHGFEPTETNEFNTIKPIVMRVSTDDFRRETTKLKTIKKSSVLDDLSDYLG